MTGLLGSIKSLSLESDSISSREVTHKKNQNISSTPIRVTIQSDDEGDSLEKQDITKIQKDQELSTTSAIASVRKEEPKIS